MLPGATACIVLLVYPYIAECTKDIQYISSKIIPRRFSISQRAEIIAAVQSHFRSGLVFLLHGEEQLKSRQEQRIAMEVTKYLTSRAVPTAVVSTKNPFLDLQSSFSNPLRVLLTTDSTIHEMFDDYHLSGVIWLAFLEEGHTLQELLGNTYIRFNVVFLVASCADKEVRLMEVYRVARDTELRSVPFGVYRDTLSTPSLSLNLRRRSLEGHTIKAVSRNETPVVLAPGNNQISGFYGVVWKVLESVMNFKTVVSVPANNLWGSPENGSWTGAMGILVRGEAEVAVCGLTMTATRAHDVKFTMPVAIFHDRIFINSEDIAESVSWGKFLRAFSAKLWLTVLVFIVILSVVLRVCYQIGILHNKEEATKFSLSDSFFCVLAAFCQQGNSSTPLTAQCRLVFFCCYLLGVVLVCAYSAAVISFLASRDIKLPFTNLAHLHQDGTYRLGILNASGTFDKFRMAKHGLLKDVYRSNILPEESNLPPTVSSGLERVCSTKRYSFMAPLQKSIIFLRNLRCRIFVLPKDESTMPMSIAFLKNSTYFGVFQHYIQRMKETGILNKIQLETLTALHNIGDMKGTFKSVQLEDAAPILSILLSGLVVSLALFFTERYIL